MDIDEKVKSLIYILCTKNGLKPKEIQSILKDEYTLNIELIHINKIVDSVNTNLKRLLEE